jgi:rubrerythrin
MATLQQHVAPLFLKRLVRSPRGRSYVLRQAAAAEGSDEGRVFDELLARIDDEKLRKMVRVHQEDEDRHARLFAAAADRVGALAPMLPEKDQLLPRLDAALGGFFEQFERGERGVMDVYLLLQVIEERATTQFRIMEPVLRLFDPEAADMIAEIATDEVRHLKYCKAIARQYATSEEELDSTLEELRRIEAQVFGDMARANMKFCLDNGLADLPAIERPFWRALLRLGMRTQAPVPSAFVPQPRGLAGALFAAH